MAEFIKFKTLIQVGEPDSESELFEQLNIKRESDATVNVEESEVTLNINDISHVFKLKNNRAIVVLKSNKPNLISSNYKEIEYQIEPHIV